MCQNEVTEKEQIGKSIKKITPEPIEALYRQAKLAESFLGLIKDTLERCQGCSWFEYRKGIKCSLLFNTYDYESLEIGYVGENVYLLDSKFIHERFRYFLGNSNIDFRDSFCERVIMEDNEELLYERLFQIGILTSLKKSKTKQIFYTIWYNKGSDSEERMRYICIPKCYVDFDVDKMSIV